MRPRVVMSPVVRRADAMKRPTHHQFIPGMGHVAHAEEPEIPPTYPVGTKNCTPAAGTADGSVHILNPSHGAPPMRMIWLAEHQSWKPLKMVGNRMAWTADFLKRAGWAYVGPDVSAKKNGKKG